MSGSSRVETMSEFFHLLSESACMNFEVNPDDPGYERRWHEEWRAEASVWLERMKPILEHRFAALAAQPDPEWPLAKHDERFPLWSPYGDPKEPPPWRVEFYGPGGPGATRLTVAFERLPSAAAWERFQRELTKDLAMFDSVDREIRPEDAPS
jgi:hypothetical protein